MTPQTPHKVRIFRQANTPYYSASFYYQRIKIQTTLRSTDLAEAQQLAFEWYVAKLVDIKSGKQPANKAHKILRVFIPTDQTFRTASKKTLEAFQQSQRSKEYLRSLANRFDLVNAMIGHTSIQDWTQQSWEQFKAELQQTKPNLSPSTLNNYKYAIQDILNEAHKRNELKQQFRFAREYNPRKETSRTYFDEDNYEKLVLGNLISSCPNNSPTTSPYRSLGSPPRLHREARQTDSQCRRQSTRQGRESNSKGTERTAKGQINTQTKVQI